MPFDKKLWQMVYLNHATYFQKYVENFCPGLEKFKIFDIYSVLAGHSAKY